MTTIALAPTTPAPIGTLVDDPTLPADLRLQRAIERLQLLRQATAEAELVLQRAAAGPQRDAAHAAYLDASVLEARQQQEVQALEAIQEEEEPTPATFGQRAPWRCPSCGQVTVRLPGHRIQTHSLAPKSLRRSHVRRPCRASGRILTRQGTGLRPTPERVLGDGVAHILRGGREELVPLTPHGQAPGLVLVDRPVEVPPHARPEALTMAARQAAGEWIGLHQRYYVGREHDAAGRLLRLVCVPGPEVERAVVLEPVGEAAAEVLGHMPLSRLVDLTSWQ